MDLNVQAWSLGTNLAQGLGLGQCMRYLYRNLNVRNACRDPRCLARIAFLMATALVNSLLALLESALVTLAGVDIDAVEIPDDIVFVIGPPRSGTTLVHALLGLDEQRFVTPRTLDVAFPNCNILLRRLGPRWLMRLLALTMPSKRPMDDLPLGLETVQEDEIATNVMSGGRSPYASLSFMNKHGDLLMKYTTFEDVPPDEFLEWKDALMLFLRKLVVNSGGPGKRKRLLLKSPVHTGRVDLLRQLFPRATFVHVHRHPREVCRISMHMAAAYYPSCYLEPTTVDTVVDYTMSNYRILYESLFASRTYTEAQHEGSAGRFVEVRFDELDSSTNSVDDVIRVLDRVYETLGLGKVPQKSVEAFLDDLLIVRQFKKNVLAAPMSAALHKRMEDETEFVRRRYGYR